MHTGALYLTITGSVSLRPAELIILPVLINTSLSRKPLIKSAARAKVCRSCTTMFSFVLIRCKDWHRGLIVLYPFSLFHQNLNPTPSLLINLSRMAQTALPPPSPSSSDTNVLQLTVNAALAKIEEHARQNDKAALRALLEYAPSDSGRFSIASHILKSNAKLDQITEFYWVNVILTSMSVL